MKILRLIVSAFMALSFTSTAGATVIGFEDFSFEPQDPYKTTFIPSGYQGFDWGGGGGGTSWVVSPNTATFFFGPNRGYEGNNYAWAGSMYLKLTAHGGGEFNFLSLAVNKALGDASTVTFDGYRNNVLVYTSVVNVDDDRATLAQYKLPKLDFYNIDRLDITNNADGGSLTIDNINVSFGAAPEPATWALMMVGIGGMGAALRTRRRKASPL